jgi:hypothetical protein
MTALEIAQALGFRHLYQILAPVVHHAVPHAILQKLQEKLHLLIQLETADRDDCQRLRLPELEVLTELEVPEMSFPLSSTDDTASTVVSPDTSATR